MADVTPSQTQAQPPVPKPRPRSRGGRSSSSTNITFSPAVRARTRTAHSESSDAEAGSCHGTGTVAAQQAPTAPATDSRQPLISKIPENNLYSDPTSVVSQVSQPPSELESQQLQQSVERLRAEEVELRVRVEERRRELGLLEERIRTSRLKERELELQSRLDEASDRESANIQESLRLRQEADILHMRKKELDHREFDLDNFSDSVAGGSDGLEGRRAELREREEKLRQMDVEVSARERELDQRQTNFQRWMRDQQALILQRMSELRLGEVDQPTLPSQPYTPPTHSSPYHHPHPSHAYTHQLPATPSQQAPPPPTSHYTPHNITPSPLTPYTHHFTPVTPVTQSPTVNTGSYGVTPHETAYPSETAQSYAGRYVAPYGSPAYAPGTGTSTAGGFSQFTSPQSVSSGGVDTANPTASSSSASSAQTGESFIHTSHGIIRSGGSTGYSAGIVGGVGVVSGSGHGPSSSGRQHTINIDEELAHHLKECGPPAQTTDEISADAEYARQLDQELNTVRAPAAVDRDRELALALMANDLHVPTGDTAIQELSSPTVQKLIANRIKEEQQRKLQEQHDAELARTLEAPAGEDQLNDLGS